MRVSVLDIGLSNSGSVKNMIDSLHMDVDSEVIHDTASLDQVNVLILPGVGNFSAAANIISDIALRAAIQSNLGRTDFKILGICLGMQLLGNWSEEGEGEGLGLVEGYSESLFKISPSMRVPNMGWCDVIGLGGISYLTRFYHVHSYHFKPAHSSDVWLKAKTSNQEIVVGIKHNQIYGVQFHPEKSHRFGREFFRLFLENAL